MKFRTAQINAIRGLLAEYGEVMPKGRSGIRRGIAEALERVSERLPAMVIETLREQWARVAEHDAQVGEIERRLRQWHRSSEASQRIAEIPGVGVLGATAAVATMGEMLELHPVMRAGALRFLQPMLDVDPLQGIGQRRALRPRAPMGSDLGGAVALGLLGRGGLGLVEQPELPVGELLRRRGESLGKEQAHLLLQPLDHRVALENLRFVVTHPRVQLGEFV